MMAGFGLIWILVLVAIAFGVLALIRKAGGTESGGSPPVEDSAEEILRRRYARGEIDRDEYEDHLQQLRR